MSKRYVLPPSTKVCNCAGCRKLLLGASQAAFHDTLNGKEREKYPPLTAGRFEGRPYCIDCLRAVRGIAA